MKGYIQKKIDPFSESKKIIYAKPYLQSTWFEELVTHLPNDLVYQINEEELRTNRYGALLKLIALVSNSIPGIPNFPFELNFSLINEGVVELDSIFSEDYNQNRSRMYKPYFFEFFGYCRGGEGLFKLLKYYLENEKNYFTCLIDFSSDYDYYKDDNVVAVIEGYVLFSASPIQEKSGKLIIVDTDEKPDPKFASVLDDSIYSCSTPTIKKSDKMSLKKVVDNMKLPTIPQNAIIYNVGQANNVSIEMGRKKSVFFDVGLTKSKVERTQAKVKEAIEEFRKIQPELVVLSHWDIDHILGVVYADNSIYNATWIVPDLWGLKRYTYKRKDKIKYKYLSDSAKRLLKYLDYRNPERLFIIDENWEKDCIYSSDNQMFQIWSGARLEKLGENEAKEKYCITAANNFGLCITLKNKKKILLPGDCEYSVLPNAIWKNNYEYIVASHHCSKMSKIPLTKKSSNKKAILSYGITNTYGHPDIQQIKELSEIGYEIVTTVGNTHIQCNLK